MQISTVAAALALTLLTAAAPARAQAEAPAGVRATGMGGAFVAVADDASAAFWNPAGLASGSYFSVALDTNHLNTDDGSAFPHDRSALMIALGTPALGLSYFTNTVTRAGEFAPLTPFNPTGSYRVERLETRHVGATVVQSIRQRIAVGATVKVVRGSASSGFVPAADRSAFDSADELFPQKASTKFDADFGVMLTGAVGKVGLAVRNAFEPEFDTPEGIPLQLERRVRGGLSLLLRQFITVAADFDFTDAPTSHGEWRDAAIGAEARLTRRAFARSGVHWNTAGGDNGPGAAPVFSVGGSYAVYGSVLADAQLSMGSSDGDTGWGVGVRFVF